MSQPKLTSYDIVTAFQRVLFIQSQSIDVDPETLEALDTEAIEILDGLGTAPEEKLEALRAVSLRLQAEEKLIAGEIQSLTRSRRSAVRAVERVRCYARDILIARRAAGCEPKIKTPTHSFRLQKSTSLEGPSHVSAWHEMGWTRTKEEPDKVAATNALKAGVEADGFRLAVKESIRWT